MCSVVTCFYHVYTYFISADPCPCHCRGGGARDNEASAAPCSPSLTCRSAALRRHDLSRNAMPFRCGKTDVFEPFGWPLNRVLYIDVSKPANGPRPSPSRSLPSFTAMLSKRGEECFFPSLGLLLAFLSIHRSIYLLSNLI